MALGLMVSFQKGGTKRELQRRWSRSLGKAGAFTCTASHDVSKSCAMKISNAHSTSSEVHSKDTQLSIIPLFFEDICGTLDIWKDVRGKRSQETPYCRSHKGK